MCVSTKLTSASGCGGTELNPSPVDVRALSPASYRVLREPRVARGTPRSVDRKCAGRNASEGIEPRQTRVAVVAELVFDSEGDTEANGRSTTGVQVHSMHTRLMLETERSRGGGRQVMRPARPLTQGRKPRAGSHRREVRYRHK